MVLVAAMGEVHANDIETSGAELVDGLDGVGLGSNGADDGGSTEVSCWLVLGVQLRKPLDLGSSRQMICGSCHDDGFVGR